MQSWLLGNVTTKVTNNIFLTLTNAQTHTMATQNVTLGQISKDLPVLGPKLREIQEEVTWGRGFAGQ